MSKLKRMTNLVVYNFLQWFVNEQVEEVATVEEIIIKLEMKVDTKVDCILVEARRKPRLMLDKELGARAAGQ